MYHPISVQLTESSDTAATQPPGGRLLCLLFLCSAVVLALCGSFVDWTTVFVNGMRETLNDQVGYISVARNLAESGRMESDIIYPSTLPGSSNKNYLYLPGHYLALAAVYKLFGYTPAHSFWPSLAAFLLSAVLTAVIATALLGRSLAVSSWALFVFFPFNLAYAFTAMAEMTVTASVLAALALFLAIPPKWKAWLGPITLAIPLLFRETGVVIAVVMAAVIYKESGGRWVPVARFCLLTLLVTALMLMSPVARGRGRSTMLQNEVLGASDTAVIADAAFASTQQPGAEDWAAGIWKKMVRNTKQLCAGRFSRPHPDLLEEFGLYFLVSGIPLALWLWLRTRDAVYFSVFLMCGGLLLAVLGLNQVWSLRGVRALLLTQPFVALLWSKVLRDRWENLPRNRALAGLAAALWVGFGIVSVYRVFASESQLNRRSAKDTAFLESLQPDNLELLVSPFGMSLDFVLKHHPAKWAFIPANDATLRLLDHKYPIGTLVLRDANARSLNPAVIASLGLIQEADRYYRKQKIEIYKRAVAEPATIQR